MKTISAYRQIESVADRSQWTKQANGPTQGWWRIPVVLTCGHSAIATKVELSEKRDIYCVQCLMQSNTEEHP